MPIMPIVAIVLIVVNIDNMDNLVNGLCCWSETRTQTHWVAGLFRLRVRAGNSGLVTQPGVQLMISQVGWQQMEIRSNEIANWLFRMMA